MFYKVHVFMASCLSYLSMPSHALCEFRIPEEITNLTHMKALVLGNNQFSGALMNDDARPLEGINI